MWALKAFAAFFACGLGGLGGCGRIGYDNVAVVVDDGGTTPGQLALAPPAQQPNVNFHVVLAAPGGTGDYRYSIVSGDGRVDSDAGEFIAPNYAGDTIVRAIDTDGESVDQTITSGGSTLFAMGGWGGYTRDKVYRSTAGAAWTVDNLEISRGETVTVVFRDKIFMTGGWFCGNNIASVLTSDTGVIAARMA